VDHAPPAGVSSLAEVHSELGAVLRDARYGESGLRRVLGATPDRAGLVFWLLDGSPSHALAAVRRWPAPTRAGAALVVELVAVLPALNVFGRSDSYLSAELYSGATVRAVAGPSSGVVERLPRSARRVRVTTGRAARCPSSTGRWRT
jgi:hypothetical protein